MLPMTTPGSGARRRPVPAPPRFSKTVLVVLDFDGFLVNSYELLKATFDHFGLDVGDEKRFKHRRKFLKYVGGGKEFLSNLVSVSLPKKKKLRERLTEEYIESGRLFPEFVPFINDLIAEPDLHVGVLSRNFTYSPGLTMRTVLRRSGVAEADLDFVIPIPAGTKKVNILEAMRASRYRICLFGADELSDYRAACETGYQIVMAGYGFDSRERLVRNGDVPMDCIFNDPSAAVRGMREILGVQMRHSFPVPATT